MLIERSSGFDDRSTIVVSGGLAARQWEAHLADAPIQRGQSAWVTPGLLGYHSWLERLWLDGPQDRPVPLTRLQSAALWRRVVAESAEGAELIGHRGAAEWAADAWSLLHHWQMDPAEQRAMPQQQDYRAFLGWCRRYRTLLEAHGWVDPAELEGLLLRHAALPAQRLILADLDDPAPAARALFEQLTGAGWSIERWSAPPATGTQRCARLADAADELRTAMIWAREHLARRPQARVALVVAGLAERHAEVERALADAFTGDSPPAWQGGRPLLANPWIGAAMTGIALTAPRTPYEALGRWLRSPFFSVAAPSERARRAFLDVQLRTQLWSQLPFTTAYADAGLAEWLGQRAPATAATLAAARRETAAVQRATPSGWARLWQNALARLEWALPAAGANDPVLLGWHGALDDFARLTPLTGELSVDSALLELEKILERPGPAALPLRGLHVLARIDEVGPGYDAVWVTGFTDSYWPEPPRGNPLLPRALQRAHRMPRSSPQEARDRSARSLERLLRRVPDLIISWPARVYDYEAEPCPSIRHWPQVTPEDLGAAFTARSPSRPRTLPRETVADPAPPLRQPLLHGGAAALNRQAGCPLRAFCQDRLGARALEPLTFGLPARLRGIATHRAAEWLFAKLPSQAQLIAISAGEISRSVERALGEVFGRSRHPLHALFELEAQRLSAVLGELLARDAARLPFQVTAVEQLQEARIGSCTLRLRLDRLDRLSDGSVAIIDYKTGKRATGAGWLSPRLRDAQVPLYATQSAAPVGAAVIARLWDGDTAYVGFSRNDDFPNQARRLPGALDWADQIELWRRQIEELVAEFAAGDTRMFLADLSEAKNAYAPLTRVLEQLALARGSLPSW